MYEKTFFGEAHNILGVLKHAVRSLTLSINEHNLLNLCKHIKRNQDGLELIV